MRLFRGSPERGRGAPPGAAPFLMALLALALALAPWAATAALAYEEESVTGGGSTYTVTLRDVGDTDVAQIGSSYVFCVQQNYIGKGGTVRSGDLLGTHHYLGFTRLDSTWTQGEIDRCAIVTDFLLSGESGATTDEALAVAACYVWHVETPQNTSNYYGYIDTSFKQSSAYGYGWLDEGFSWLDDYAAEKIAAGWTGHGVRLYHETIDSHGTDYGTQKGQDLAYFWVTKAGYAQVRKVSANATCTDGNPNYSLAGAEYGVYSDPECTQLVTTLTTKSDGTTDPYQIAIGTYYVREITPSEGYQLDTNTYTLSVGTANTKSSPAVVTSREVPINDPTVATIHKVDADTGLATPQGDASYAGAEFTVKFYPLDVDDEWDAESLADEEPQSVLVFRTDDEGYAEFRSKYLVSSSGTSFLDSATGGFYFPRGVITIEETAAPEGYLLPDPAEVHVQAITGEGSLARIGEGNAMDDWSLAQYEPVLRGSVSVIKRDAETGAAPQGDADFAGISFGIVNMSENPVYVDGQSYAPGEVCCTITTGSDGTASTPDGYLPVGTYAIREVATNASMRDTAADVTFSIVDAGGVAVTMAADGVTEQPEFEMDDEVVRGGVTAYKADRELGLPYALGAASLDGATFEVRNASAAAVVSGGVTYQPGDVVATLTIRDGEASTASDALPYGTYTIREVAVGEGYLLTDATLYTFQIRSDGQVAEPADWYVGTDAGARLYPLATTNYVGNQVKRGDFEFDKKADGRGGGSRPQAP